MALVVDKKVLGLEITVDNVEIVEVLKAHNHFGREELCNVVREVTVAVDVRKHFTAVDVLDHKVEIFLVLKVCVELRA